MFIDALGAFVICFMFKGFSNPKKREYECRIEADRFLKQTARNCDVTFGLSLRKHVLGSEVEFIRPRIDYSCSGDPSFHNCRRIQMQSTDDRLCEFALQPRRLRLDV